MSTDPIKIAVLFLRVKATEQESYGKKNPFNWLPVAGRDILLLCALSDDLGRPRTRKSSAEGLPFCHSLADREGWRR
ncbi:hypothetical protein CDAR_307711 [Caerostris darwini]|uniref:Uncharacterized protein n=1 Tax=Caerostris darwini TaxID=1538125 RepID=A0AAV4WFY2_9ARAC|nr:hypothetical protein CDAR_307711 [Caerostris darwini]